MMVQYGPDRGCIWTQPVLCWSQPRTHLDPAVDLNGPCLLSTIYSARPFYVRRHVQVHISLGRSEVHLARCAFAQRCDSTKPQASLTSHVAQAPSALPLKYGIVFRNVEQDGATWRNVDQYAQPRRNVVQYGGVWRGKKKDGATKIHDGPYDGWAMECGGGVVLGMEHTVANWSDHRAQWFQPWTIVGQYLLRHLS
jgi:hypothetical protein